MRAKEFIVREATLSLSDIIKTAAGQNQSQTKNPNATKTPNTTQGAQGSMGAQQAGSQQTQAGGIKPQTNVTPAPGATPQAPAPGATTQTPVPGAVSAVQPAQGANPNAGKPMGQPDATTTQGSIGNQTPDLSKMNPAQLQQIFKPGKELNVPGLGKMTAGKMTPQGLELDASKVPGIDAKKITIDLKSLSKT